MAQHYRMRRILCITSPLRLNDMKPVAETRKSTPVWPELSTVQRWFQAVITNPRGVDAGVESEDASVLLPLSRDELEQMVTRSARVSARDRLAIYANAYYARLVECLGDSFPVLKRTLGEDLFGAFAFDYLQRHPSHSYTLNRLGDGFAAYLAETRPDRQGNDATANDNDAQWPDFLIDLARFEQALAEVFDGPGIEGRRTVQAEDLESVPLEQWPSVRVETVPCLRLLATRFPINAYFTEARQAQADAELRPPLPQDAYAAITRRDYIVRRHELSHAQYRLLRALQDGHTLGEAIEEAAAVYEGADDEFERSLGRWFLDWTRARFFLAVETGRQLE